MKFLSIFVFLAGIGPGFGVRAEVYRCQAGDRTTYTDQPCAPGAMPASLPPLSTVPGDRKAPSLARQYDADEKREAESHGKADQEWVSRQRAQRSQQDAIRTAVIEHRVVKGMTRGQVEQALNEPSRVDGQGGTSERWIYLDGRERRTIAFKDGIVSSDSGRNGGSTRR